MADESEADGAGDAGLAFAADTGVFGIRPLNTVNHGPSWYHKTCVPSNVLGHQWLFIVVGMQRGRLANRLRWEEHAPNRGRLGTVEIVVGL